MPVTLNFYLDDSGTRHPTHKIGKKAAHGYDWFALGGILVRSDEEDKARDLHAKFCEKWEITAPLHSSEIRSQNENFGFLREWENKKQGSFYEDLYILMREVPVLGIACTVDRPGYCGRYLEQYQQKPWLLCRTSFSVVVERAAKHAVANDMKLRVYPERCNKTEDANLEGYYKTLKAEGMPFASENSAKYAPLSQEKLSKTLYEFKTKYKTSPMAQLADLYLWPICMGGYHASNRTYQRLIKDRKLIDCHIEKDAFPMLGSKYSCFENVERKA